MTLQRVELIRERAARGFSGELVRQRIFMSQVGGNLEAIDRLNGRPGAELLARLVEVTMEHIGHVTTVDLATDTQRANARSKVGRIARAKMPKALEPAIGPAAEALPPPPVDDDDDQGLDLTGGDVDADTIYAPVLTRNERNNLNQAQRAAPPPAPMPARARKAAKKK